MSEENPQQSEESRPAEENEPRKCRGCGKPLPADSNDDLCPACLLRPTADSPHQNAWTIGPGRRFQPPTAAELDEHFPQLDILELLGRGGMGAVYRARQKSLGRDIAVKILPPEIAAQEGFIERFTREARALARLNHPHIVTIFDFGKTGPYAFLMMELIEGVNLRHLLSEGKLDPAEALQIVPQLCDALQVAHSQGVVHRDIKPENILLDTQGNVKIADFGLAKLAGRGTSDDPQSGAVVGTMYYMAPEQIEHPDQVDHRADIYSMGVVFYEMLTGELPLGRFQPPSGRVQVDVRLDQVVLRTLEKQPELRYGQASEVKTDVQQIGSTPGHAQTPRTSGAAGPHWSESLHQGAEYASAGAQWMGAQAKKGLGTGVSLWQRIGPSTAECLAGAALVVQLLALVFMFGHADFETTVAAILIAGPLSVALARSALIANKEEPLPLRLQWLTGIPLAVVYIPIATVLLLWPFGVCIGIFDVYYSRPEQWGVHWDQAPNEVFGSLVFACLLVVAAAFFIEATLAWCFPTAVRFLFRPFAEGFSGRRMQWVMLATLLAAIASATLLAGAVDPSLFDAPDRPDAPIAAELKTES